MKYSRSKDVLYICKVVSIFYKWKRIISKCDLYVGVSFNNYNIKLIKIIWKVLMREANAIN